MLSYRDTTFCEDSKICKNATNCHRNFTASDAIAAVKWWGGCDAPIAFASFKDYCKDFKGD